MWGLGKTCHRKRSKRRRPRNASFRKIRETLHLHMEKELLVRLEVVSKKEILIPLYLQPIILLLILIPLPSWHM